MKYKGYLPAVETQGHAAWRAGHHGHMARLTDESAKSWADWAQYWEEAGEDGDAQSCREHQAKHERKAAWHRRAARRYAAFGMC
jgi:hypothetical protein